MRRRRAVKPVGAGNFPVAGDPEEGLTAEDAEDARRGAEEEGSPRRHEDTKGHEGRSKK